MDGGRNAVHGRKIRNPLGLPDASRGQRVRVDDVHRVVLDQGTESFLQAEQAFAGVDGRDGGFLDFLVGAPIPGGVAGTQRTDLQEIFRPGEFELFEIVGMADGVVDVERSEVVGRQGRFPADGVAYGLNLFAVHLEALGRGHTAAVQPGRAASGPGGAGDQGPRPADGVAYGLNVFAVHLQALGRGHTAAVQPAGAAADHRGHDVHLEEREASLFAGHHALGINLGTGAFRGIAVAAHAAAVLGAHQPPRGDAVHLARDVVEGDIDRAESAAHAALVGEVANPVQDGFNLQRVPAHEVRLQHQRHAFVAGIADFTEAVHTLVGVDLDDRIIVVCGDADRPHVGDPQLARRGVPVEAAALLRLQI